MRNAYVELKKKVERNEQLTAMDIEHIETLKGFFTTKFGSIYLRKDFQSHFGLISTLMSP